MKASYRTLLVRFVLFSVLWWLLTDSVSSSWLVGFPVVVLATYVSASLLPAMSWSVPGIFRFIVFFLWHSLRGGIDVAGRALHPDMPISPSMHYFKFSLPAGPRRVLMANVLNLLPGTLSVEVDEEGMQIHVLDDTGSFAEELQILEKICRQVNS